MTYKPTVLVDFDGVIHRYSRGWADGTAYDVPMPNSQSALAYLDASGYEVIIFSTRDADQIYEWLKKNGFREYPVTNVKQPAVAIIDDRAIRFHDWSEAIDQLFGLYPIKKTEEF